MIRPLSILGALVLAAPAAAQSFEEAVWANMALALQLCENKTGGNMGFWTQQFRNAGFAERVDRSTMNSDTTHWFTAPAETVVVELYYGEMPEHCMVRTRFQGVTRSSQLLDALIPQMYPGYVRRVEQGPPDPRTGQPVTCVRYEDPTNPIGHVVGVVSPTAQACVEDGTSQFYSSYRV